MRFSNESRLKEAYSVPIGKDIIDLIISQMGKNPDKVLNGVTMNMKLKTLVKMSKGQISDKVMDTFINMLNNEENWAEVRKSENIRKWWKEAIIYQVYPRSFKDSNGDGIGDIQGIISKLDYIKDLGANCIWLSPIYDSPNDDNGYDIRDYRKIMDEFGTMEDFDKLLMEVHKRGMRLIMDLVVNHTSDEHEWFKKAISDEKSKYRDYYFIREGKEDNPPNNWTSLFSGKAWRYYKDKKLWALHLFSSKQMDLNWENENVRKDVEDIVNWWLNKGIDGFRMDVINFISKDSGLPDGAEDIGNMIGIFGIEHYVYGPKLHDYLRELNKKTFGNYDAVSVGETPGVGLEMAKLMTSEERREINMVFNFEHLDMPGKNKYDDYEYDLNYYKQYMIKWMENYTGYSWMSIFCENHDNIRAISKINKDDEFRAPIGKLLALMQMTLKGTPFIYQGQELGSINNKFKSMEEIRDIESINMYEKLRKDVGDQKAFEIIRGATRDNARVPMKWNGEKNAGFTTGTPWISGDSDYLRYNVKAEESDPQSVLNFYKKLISIRKDNEAFIYGDIEIVNKDVKDLFTYYRSLKGKKYYVECNLSSKNIKRKRTKESMVLILSNYKNSEGNVMRPYEANLYEVK